MDHHCFARCWRYIVLALMFFSGSVFAYSASSSQYTANFSRLGLIGVGATPSEACGSLASHVYLSDCGVGVSGSVSGMVCNLDNITTPTTCPWHDTGSITTSGVPVCGANSTLSGSDCVCNSGFTDNGSACVSTPLSSDDDACITAARLSLLAPKEGYDISGYVDDQTLCLSASGVSSGKGCKSAFVAGVKYTKADGSKITYGVLTPVDGVGSSCVLPPLPLLPVANPCPSGQPGSVNGVSVCIPYPAGTTSETTTKSGSTGKDANGVDKAVDQSSKTVCTGNSCNTTTTTNVTVGGSTTTTTTTNSGSKASFCTQNPQDKQCGNSGSGGSGFSGSCQASFQCDGDAVQCAMAKEQFTRNCQTLEKDTDASSVTNKALAGTDNLNTDKMKADAAAAKVDVGSFDTAGRGWGRGCPADPVIVISWAARSNAQFSIPFSSLCANGVLALLANGAVAITLLGALAWVIGTKASSNA